MGSQWKMEPNMATWHNALEQEGPEHACYRLSMTPEDCEPNGYVYLDRDTRARMTVFLYYGHKEAATQEERNEYKRIYCQWHPQSYSFRNLNYQAYRNIRIQGDESEDEPELPPLTAYDENDEFDNPFAWNLANTQALAHTGAHYAQLPETLAQLIDERSTNCRETVVIGTNLGPKINYYSKKAIEVAHVVKNIQAKLGNSASEKYTKQF